MSVDPSSFNFDTGMSNVGISDPNMGLNTTGLGTNIQPFDPQGPINEGDLVPGAGPSAPSYDPLGTVNINANTGTIDPSTIGNPFAGPGGGPPITASNFTPQMSNISFNPSPVTSQLGTELGLSGGVSTPSGGGGGGGGGFSGSNLLNDAALMGIGAYGLSQAKSAQNQINQEIQPLQSESQSMLAESQQLIGDYNNGTMPSWAQSTFNQMNNEGNSLVSNYTNGKLPSSEQSYANELNKTGSQLIQQYKSGSMPGWAKSYVDWTSSEATALINASPTKALETLATQNFTDYTSGKLKPADQVQLDQSVAAQKQRVASMLAASGQSDSSVLAAQYQQIDNQAQITRQQVLNSYFQTGDQAYNSWLSTNVNAAQIKAQGAQFANTVFSTMLQDGLQATEFAANYTAQGLQTELQAGLQAQEYAGTYKEKTFTDMLNGGMQAATIGNQALTQAIGIQLQSDNQLSHMVGSLMQSIATAYSYSAYQRGTGGGYGGGGGPGTGGGGGGGPGLLASIVGGIEQYGGAAVKGFEGLFSSAGGQAANSGAATAAGAASTAIGAVAAGYSLYNTVKNWQSGSTGSDALNGAETGASIGAIFGPVGFVVGGIIGGAVGAISSAFGGGKNDPETLNWDNIAPQLNQNPNLVNQMTASQAFQSIAGIMDAKNNSPGHSTVLEQKFGRMGENSVMTSMAGWINQAIKSGQVPANASPGYIYCSVVMPKLQQMGAYVQSSDIVTKNGTQAGQSVNALLTRLIGLWQSGNLSSSTPVGISGQTIQGLPQYGA